MLVQEFLSKVRFCVTVAPYVHEDPAREAKMRARAVLDALPSATRQLGSRPTYAVMSPDLKINLDILEGEGHLEVLRLRRDRAQRLWVDLVVRAKVKPHVVQEKLL